MHRSNEVAIEYEGTAVIQFRIIGSTRAKNAQGYHIKRHDDHDSNQESNSNRRLVATHDHSATNRSRGNKKHHPDTCETQGFIVLKSRLVVVGSENDRAHTKHRGEQDVCGPQIRDDTFGVTGHTTATCTYGLCFFFAGLHHDVFLLLERSLISAYNEEECEMAE